MLFDAFFLKPMRGHQAKEKHARSGVGDHDGKDNLQKIKWVHPSKMALNRRPIKPAVEMTQAAQFLERLFYWDTP